MLIVAHQMQSQKFTLEVAGKTLEVEKNILAPQAHGSVLVSYGDTSILATCVMAKKQREGIEYFPLMIDYEERFYAAGKIPGSFMKREGRPSEEAILTGRLIDRTLRPLFNHNSRTDVQVVITVLSVDGENDPDTLAIIAASCSLATSPIPWGGPVAAVRIGLIDDQLVVNPTFEQRKNSQLDLVVSGTKEKINMIEAGAKEVSEDMVHQAFELAQKEIEKISLFQEEIVKKIGEEKFTIVIAEKDISFEEDVKNFLIGKLDAAIYEPSRMKRVSNLGLLEEELKKYVVEKYPEEADIKKKKASIIYEEEIDRIVHDNIINHDKRPDGRKSNELRDISCEVGIFKRSHGSGFFMRGTTQALSMLTLGSPGDKQLIDTMGTSSEKRFMHHYNFPAYSVGEIGPMRGPGRREIGHGALAERALEAIIPSEKEFPYTIRVVSEILSSNGSSSMASVCGSILAMMDGGVPIKKPAAGIAMGLMFDKGGNYKILTDIQGPEDHHGDMDFKVAGTRDGVAAIQMDVKIDGITPKIAAEVLAQAREARLQIIEKMEQAIAKPRADLSLFAPRIYTLQINPDKIGAVIGPGGKVINEIIRETGVAINIEDDGIVLITSPQSEAANKAIAWVKSIVKEAQVGEIYEGKVVKIMPFGAFVEIFPGTDGLLHISEIENRRIEKVEDVLKTGQAISVKVKEITPEGKINLTHKGISSDK